jgi:DNA invertase Pin-like site-specific DNA recombinase
MAPPARSGRRGCGGQPAARLPRRDADGVLIRQVLGAVAQLDKAMTVAKLKAARDRKKARAGKWEGPRATPRRDAAGAQAAQGRQAVAARDRCGAGGRGPL